MNSSNKTALFACLLLVAVAAYAIPKMADKRAEMSGAEEAAISPAAGPAHDVTSKDPVAAAIKDAKGKADVTVVKAWAMASNGKTGAAFLTLENKGAGNTILVAAESPVAKRVEFHTHIMDAGIARMRPIGTVVLPAGQTVEMKPGGLHVMLFDLKQPIVAGQSFPLRLKFNDGKVLETDVSVQAEPEAAPAPATESPLPASGSAVPAAEGTPVGHDMDHMDHGAHGQAPTE